MFDYLTARDLAEFMGVTIGFVYHIKSGRRRLPLKYVKAVSQRFAIPLHVLRPDVYDPPV